MPTFTYSFEVQAPLDAVWRFHDDPHMLPRVMPKLTKMRVMHADRPPQPGSRIQIEMAFGPLRWRWHLRLREHQPPTRFTDEQVPGEGPFAVWRHTHAFQALDACRTRVSDTIVYELPFGVVGRMAGALFGNLAMRLLFVARERATRCLLESP